MGGVVLGLFTGAAYAGFLLVQRLGNRDPRRPAGPLMDATASSAVASAAAGLVLGQITFLPSWPSLGWLVILALSAQVVGYLLISVAARGSRRRSPRSCSSSSRWQPWAWPCSSSASRRRRPSCWRGLVVGGVLLATARAPRGRQAAVAEAAEGPWGRLSFLR